MSSDIWVGTSLKELPRPFLYQRHTTYKAIPNLPLPQMVKQHKLIGKFCRDIIGCKYVRYSRRSRKIFVVDSSSGSVSVSSDDVFVIVAL